MDLIGQLNREFFTEKVGRIIIDAAFVVLYIAILAFSIKSTYLITSTAINQTTETLSNSTIRLVDEYNKLGHKDLAASKFGFLGFLFLFIAGIMIYLHKYEYGVQKIFLFLLISLGIICTVLLLRGFYCQVKLPEISDIHLGVIAFITFVFSTGFFIVGYHDTPRQPKISG